MTHEVDYLWFQGCPNHEAARPILEEVIDDLAPGTPVPDTTQPTPRSP